MPPVQRQDANGNWIWVDSDTGQPVGQGGIGGALGGLLNPSVPVPPPPGVARPMP